jgi:hypothetical protein
MGQRMKKSSRTTKQALDMADHATRLKSLPGSSWESLRQFLIWIAAGIILIALGWLAIGR